MRLSRNESGVAVIMLLLTLPLLLVLYRISLSLHKSVQDRQKMREQCFLVSLEGLRGKNSPEKALTALRQKLPDSAAGILEVPDFESPAAKQKPQLLVFDLLNGSAHYSCGATAEWRNDLWHYEIVLDRL